MKLSYYSDWNDFNNLPFEIVERKGLGHPDTLADGLAEAVSNEYSKYCLHEFGVIPHHNVDKLYIGAGLFSVEFGKNEMIKPAKIRINGRISDKFGNNQIDLVTLQRKAIKDYLQRVLPRAALDTNIIIEHNATQNTRRKNWFSPETKDDLPELKKLVANDTSVCVAHAPLSMAEKVCIAVERYFWNIDEKGQVISPKFSNVGQDIKVMVIREGQDIKVDACIPIYSDTISSIQDYKDQVLRFEDDLRFMLKQNKLSEDYNISLYINNSQSGSWHPYMLGLGSCIECGEEGLVGRGNGISGLIPTMRAKSNEAYFGKNPVYHVGRVLGLLTQRIANRIYHETGSGNSVYTLAVHSDDLLPPTNVCVNLQDISVKEQVEQIIKEEFSPETYINKIIDNIITSDFSMKLL